MNAQKIIDDWLNLQHSGNLRLVELVDMVIEEANKELLINLKKYEEDNKRK